jgi:hypothetical protein
LQSEQPHAGDARSGSTRPASTDDKWAALRAYRKARGLCFICGERWARDHQCKGTVQLHVIQEILGLFPPEETEQEQSSSSDSSAELQLLTAVTAIKDPSTLTFQLTGVIQGQQVQFLVDSGSTHSFLNSTFLPQFSSIQTLPHLLRVKVANGQQLLCTQALQDCPWMCDGHEFSANFKFFSLGSYDGILGLDWLARHSPMRIDWEEQWMSFDHQDVTVTLQSHNPHVFTCTVVELLLLHEDTENDIQLPSEVLQLLQQFAPVFEEPVGLPPRRLYDHSIPLVPGAQPVNKRPYRYTPQLKSEIERQVNEMLSSGVIRTSSSAFSSPIILVRKKDNTWRIVVDYRHLNALTIKSKYPVPIIDELLDELAGSSWFSKLDLWAGYHQIRLAPGEEYKTAFQTHHGQFEFTVMAFGLTGAPATFLSAMNDTLQDFLRKFVLVFFDDILIYSKNYQEHIQHIALVLKRLQDHHWQVKQSKCAFAQQTIAYLGHLISAAGVSTDPEKIHTVKEWPVPTTAKELRLSGYYRKFVKHYGIIAKPLTNLLRKGELFVWTPATKTAFQTLKTSLISAPMLALPDFTKKFTVETDASDTGIGAVLLQDGHPLAFVSSALGPKTRGLSTYEKEHLAILLAVDQWRPYLQVGEFQIITD